MPCRQAFLDGFARQLEPEERAVMVLDGAGWHVSHAWRVPAHVALVPLPPCAPELNPVERVWLDPRERHLGRRMLGGYRATIDALCRAWRQLSTHRLKSLTGHPHIEQVNC